MLFNTVLFTGNANPALAQEIATHLGIELGKAKTGRFSDGAILAIEKAMPRIFKEDWLDVLEPDEIMQSVKDICNPPKGAS